MCRSSKDKAAHARPFWNAATRHGTPEATTTFHNQHDKRDYHYSYGRCGEFVRQEGKRGLALGYLTKVRFARFLSMPLAAELTGLDLTRPGRSAEQASRVAVVAEEFFELLVRYSRSHPFRDGDYGNVARSRQLQDGSFCIFTGFVEAVASHKMKALREAWRARYAPVPAPARQPSTPDRAATPPPAAAKVANATVCRSRSGPAGGGGAGAPGGAIGVRPAGAGRFGVQRAGADAAVRCAADGLGPARVPGNAAA